MRSDKGEAFVLRRAGKSYREIATTLGVSKSTLSSWFAGVDFSSAIKEELTKKALKNNKKTLTTLNKTRGISLDVQYRVAEKEAEKELYTYRNTPLFTTAVAMYLVQGDKTTRGRIRLMSQNPAVLGLFRRFLMVICGVREEKIKACLFLSEGHSEAECIKYWKNETGITQFHKAQWLKEQKGSTSPFGTCALLTSSTHIKHKLLLWIDQLPQVVLNTGSEKSDRGYS